MTDTTNTKRKNLNIELIRIVSMLMIVSLHTLYKGNLLGNPASLSANNLFAWFFECASITGLNMFMLVSGYLLCKADFKAARLIEIVGQVLFYSVGILLLLLIAGRRYSIYEYVKCIFPIRDNEYWFCSVYVVLYLLLPLISAGINHMSREQLGKTIITLIVFESVFKSVLPIRLLEDKSGYNLVWFLTLFLIGSYIRLYGIDRLKKPLRAYLIHIAFVLMMFAEQFVLANIYDKTGHFESIVGVSIEYNHIFALGSCVALFATFLYMPEIKGHIAKLVGYIAPFSFGVYLFHEQTLIRYEWPKWLGVEKLSNKPFWIFVPGYLGTVIFVYALGSLVDFIRNLLFKMIKRLFADTKLAKRLKSFDENINSRNENAEPSDIAIKSGKTESSVDVGSKSKKMRNSTMELLRIVAMVMIISAHALDKGSLLKLYFTTGETPYIGSWILLAFSVVGLNMYMMLSGYFMAGSKVNTKRLADVVATVLFYSVGILAVMLVMSKVFNLIDLGGLTTYDYIQCVLPLHMNTYWFCTAYVILYLLLPVVLCGIRYLSKKALGIVIVLLLVYESALKTLTPFSFETDNRGYSYIWFLVMSLLAAYIRLYGLEFIDSAKKAFCIFLAGAALIISEEFAVQLVIAKTGLLESVERVSYDHNHLFMIIACVGLFMTFVRLKPITGKVGKVINKLASASFGVYLIHEHLLVRFRWPKWFGLENLGKTNPILLIFGVIGSCISVYLICFFIDSIRQMIFKWVGKYVIKG
ncbi:MAG: acyltransferase [Lachnospiraceae bacterium]|nr:acyltransferase [Lachnospiraceae bacterium]